MPTPALVVMAGIEDMAEVAGMAGIEEVLGAELPQQ